MLKQLRHISVIWIFISYIYVLNAQGSLDTEIYIAKTETSIENYLKSFSEQTDLNFSFSSAIHPEKLKQIPKGRYKLKTALDSLFRDQYVNYIPHGNIIILSPQPKYLSNSEKLQVTGKVISGKTGKPVPYASIFFKEQSIGTISNYEGEFQLFIPQRLIDDTLSITSIGYQCALIAPVEYLTEFLTVELKQQNIHIDELVVRPDDVEDLVISSFFERYRNYHINPANWNAFFREANMQDGDYISLSEALIEIHKAGYINENEDLIKIIRGRKGENTREAKTLNLVVQGGLYNNLRLDIAKYTSPFFSEAALQEYDFKLLENTFYRDRQTYVVGFDMKDGLSYPGYKGKMYIDAKSLALVRAEFEISPKGIRYARKSLVKKSPIGYKIKPQSAIYEVDYRFYDNKWNLSHARSDIKIKVKKRHRNKNNGYNTNFRSVSEFVVTEKIEDDTRRIKYREKTKPTDILVEQVEQTSMEYWGSDNIIQPEEPLLETIRKLQNKGMLEIDNEFLKATSK